MILVTIDTNTLVPGFLRQNRDTTPVRLLDAWLAGQFTLVLSEYMLDELARTFRKSYFAHRLSDQQRAAGLALLRAHGRITALTVTVSGIAAHPEDDLVLATALSGSAQFLVTGETTSCSPSSSTRASLSSPPASSSPPCRV